MLLLVGSACTTAPSQSSEPSPSVDGPSPTSTGPGPTPSHAPLTSVEIASPRGGSVLVHGRYPRVESSCVRPVRPRLDARYPGTLIIERSDDGTLALTLTVRFRQYLEGIAEIPASWPMAALEAQAIAARTYALATTGWSGQEGETLEEPICSTSACQVYGGIPLAPSPLDRRWDRAVRRTSGRVLLYEGRPAETLYFSTSNGQTYGNDEVFGSAPLPYLRPVLERDDGASPVSGWSVRLPFDDLASFLHAAGEWGEEAIAEVGLDGGDVMVSGGGASRTMTLGTFRDAVNAWAHCLEPRRYPPGGLPTTIPSRWLSLSSGEGAVTVTGRGWGHGVGMVQWGAYGKARRGLAAEEILAFYFAGLRPEPYPEPGLIHVQIASGLTSLRIEPSAPGATLNGEWLQRDRVVIVGGDELLVRAL